MMLLQLTMSSFILPRPSSVSVVFGTRRAFFESYFEVRDSWCNLNRGQELVPNRTFQWSTVWRMPCKTAIRSKAMRLCVSNCLGKLRLKLLRQHAIHRTCTFIRTFWTCFFVTSWQDDSHLKRTICSNLAKEWSQGPALRIISLSLGKNQKGRKTFLIPLGVSR